MKTTDRDSGGAIPRSCFRALVCAALILLAGAGRAGDTPIESAPYGTRIPVPGLPGTLVLAGKRPPGAALDAFVAGAGGDTAVIVILTASDPPDGDEAPGTGDVDDTDGEAIRRAMVERGAATVAIHALARPRAEDDDGGAAAVAAAIDGATGAWFLAGTPASLTNGSIDTATRSALSALRERDGAIGASGGAAPALAELAVVLPAAPGRGPAVTPGLGLLPGCFVAELPTGGRVDGMAGVHAEHPGLFGVGLAPRTALVVEGRRGRVLGSSTVLVTQGATPRRPWRRERVRHRRTVDLIALSRAAVARGAPPFPPAKPAVPEVARGGTLFIGGGGRQARETIHRFIDAAGGPSASILVIPTAIEAASRTRAGRRDAGMLRSLGARRVTVLHADTPEHAESERVLETLRRAGGIWFTGGRQWRLVDSYLDTLAHALMHEVLRRGGAVYGSSAGASIQAEYMVRGHPLGNELMMAEGYERGLGFLPGVAIDQHFTQRGRFPDMRSLKRAYPQLIGIGIDESTMAIVTGHELEVVGEHRVAIFDRDGAPGSDETDHVVLEAGELYDLKARRMVGSP